MFNLSDSIAPQPTTVNDLAGVIRQELIAAFAIDIGYETIKINIENDRAIAITIVQDELIGELRKQAFTTFKEWAKDIGHFYNGNVALDALDQLFEAVRSATNTLSPAYRVWDEKYGQEEHAFLAYLTDTANDMADGDFRNIIAAWNELNGGPKASVA